MTIDNDIIDQLLATALRGAAVGWPAGWADRSLVGRTIDRIAYHGIAGLLNTPVATLDRWPAPIVEFVRDQSLALAMWELRHRALLGDLLASLASAGIRPLLLKGTAVAYDLYPAPATRARGDTDLLVAPGDLAGARAMLADLGYRCQPLDSNIADELALQEVWSTTCPAGTEHHIDLHWQLINAPALHGLLAFQDCETNPLRLPRLAPDAWSMSRPLTLLHTCVHRAMHLTSPYFVDGVTFYGGDRLIWANDIDLLAGALSGPEWRTFTVAALDQRVAAVCLDGIDFARRTLGTVVPQVVMASLGTVRGERASTYLLASGQARRAWADFSSIPGLKRKLAYAVARGVPSASFMRGKYPGLAHQPLAMLHVRRLTDLLRARPPVDRPG